MASGSSSFAVKGFVLWVASLLGMVLYLVWALVPDSFLHNTIGWTYYPDKYVVVLGCWGVNVNVM